MRWIENHDEIGNECGIPWKRKRNVKSLKMSIKNHRTFNINQKSLRCTEHHMDKKRIFAKIRKKNISPWFCFHDAETPRKNVSESEHTSHIVKMLYDNGIFFYDQRFAHLVFAASFP